MSLSPRALLVLPCSGLFAVAAFAQAFTSQPAQIPATGSLTENVDFGDIDQDGDWDAVIADGGDSTQDQNRVYVNLGGLQAGTVGFFQDQTATRMPVINTDGRDIEFVDLDNDGDLDLYTSNTSQLLNQTNRWWINNGAAQLGTLGFWSDDTTARWVGLGATGSSVPTSAVLGGGGFIDWSCDCDFGDLDNDGDIDLAHGTYGGAFGGNVPTRLFLNNGAGFFSEFNPSGFQLSGTNIANGNPGLWCEGTQSANTTNATGVNCDIASSALDIDLIDVDGDMDLDLLHGARQEAPRFFRNRLAETGTLAFRDVTGTAFPAGYWSGSDNYEQEMGDMDNDGDWDLYGLNWPGLSDAVFNNASTTSTITFNGMQTLSGSANDDNEGDFLDYDNDGDLDIIVAAFQSTNRLYQNNYAGGAPGSFSYTQVGSSGLTSSRALDADVADVDNDGDTDIMTAEDAGQNELLYINNTVANDTFAPRVVNLETIGNGSATSGWHVVRVHVNDNSSYYTQWYNPTWLELTVDGIKLPDTRMQSSQGQVFRARIPKNLLGAVTYKVRSTDEHANTTTTAAMNYTSSGSAVGALYGTSTNGPSGAPTIRALSLPLVDQPLYLVGENVPAGSAGFIVFSIQQAAPALDLGSGLLSNLGFPLLAVLARSADSSGKAVIGVTMPSGFAGLALNAEYVAVAGTGGNTFASSRGLAFTVP
jgi:hypothetical protein